MTSRPSTLMNLRPKNNLTIHVASIKLHLFSIWRKPTKNVSLSKSYAHFPCWWKQRRSLYLFYNILLVLNINVIWIFCIFKVSLTFDHWCIVRKRVEKYKLLIIASKQCKLPPYLKRKTASCTHFASKIDGSD